MMCPSQPLETAVRLNHFERQWREIGPEVLEVVERVGASGWYILGDEVRRFEQELAAIWGVRHAVGVGNGTDALEISLRVLGIGPGDEVLTTPLSAFATTQAILRAGAVPAFVDVDGSGLIDLEACREHLQQRPQVRALVPVHLYGHAVSLEGLHRLGEDFEIEIVEDCAQSILATSDGCPVGTAGRVAATSFYPTKNLGALGDGGAVLTDDPELADRARALRSYGQTETGLHSLVGLNSRLDEVQAAVLCDVLLPRLEEWTRRRLRIAETYMTCIDNPQITIPRPSAGCGSVWHLFPVLVTGGRGEREDLRLHLRSCGVESGAHYPIPIFEQEACRKVASVLGPCPRARAFAAREVSLPVNPFLTEDDIERVVRACNGWRPA